MREINARLNLHLVDQGPRGGYQVLASRQQHDAQEADNRNALLDGEPPPFPFVHQKLVGAEFPCQLNSLRFSQIDNTGVNQSLSMVRHGSNAQPGWEV